MGDKATSWFGTIKSIFHKKEAIAEVDLEAEYGALLTTEPRLSVPQVYEQRAPAEWTPDQLDMLKSLRYKVPELVITPEVAPESLKDKVDIWREEEIKWLDDACLLRYLRASKWKLEHAQERLLKTLEWRRVYQPHVMLVDLEPEAECGKVYLNGYDKYGQPIIYMIMRRPGSGDFERGLRWSIYLMEKAIAMMPPGVEKLNIIIDNDHITRQDATPLSITKKWIDILSSHYPERLANGFMLNPSWYVSLFFKIISPFMDPDTKSKIHFVDLSQVVRYGKKGMQEEKEQESSVATAAEQDVPALHVASGDSKKVDGWGAWTTLDHYINQQDLDAAYGGFYYYKHTPSVYYRALVQ